MIAYRVSNTNADRKGLSCFVRVYADNVKIGEVAINKHNPLAYIRNHPGSKHRSNLLKQCVENGMSEQLFNELVLGVNYAV